jgi:uncharacterized membrane protein
MMKSVGVLVVVLSVLVVFVRSVIVGFRGVLMDDDNRERLWILVGLFSGLLSLAVVILIIWVVVHFIIKFW